jgi:hypothetical protein
VLNAPVSSTDDFVGEIHVVLQLSWIDLIEKNKISPP